MKKTFVSLCIMNVKNKWTSFPTHRNRHLFVNSGRLKQTICENCTIYVINRYISVRFMHHVNLWMNDCMSGLIELESVAVVYCLFALDFEFSIHKAAIHDMHRNHTVCYFYLRITCGFIARSIPYMQQVIDLKTGNHRNVPIECNRCVLSISRSINVHRWQIANEKSNKMHTMFDRLSL